MIKAPRERVYGAFVDPEALARWLAPGDMRARVDDFDAGVGGGYRMSLFYPPTETEARGKTAEREDRYAARFVKLEAPSRIVQEIIFDSEDPVFQGAMTMVVTLDEVDGGTDVTIEFEDMPPGIRPEDNEAGTRSSLEKLARYVE